MVGSYSTGPKMNTAPMGNVLIGLIVNK